MSQKESYKIVLPEFEGPFDLLLFFIERDELDINDIPIEKITKDFLEYIHIIEKLNIELASEFILFASMLIRIKARTLLPRKELDEKGNEIDPRDELIAKLLEYKKFKAVAAEMKLLEAERLLQQARGNARQDLLYIADEASEGTEIESVNVYRLAKAFEKVMRRFKDRTDKPTHVVQRFNYSIGSQRRYLADFILQKKKATFVSIFDQSENRVHAIFTFLAMLEMIQMNLFSIVLGEGRNNFFITMNEDKEDVLTEIKDTQDIIDEEDPIIGVDQ